MSSPLRIQRQRAKGWRLPENTVIVTRPGRWSNSWKIGSSFFDPARCTFGKCETAADCVEAFRRCIDWDPNAKRTLPTEDGCLEISGGYGPEHRNRRTASKELRGKNLACWCRLCDRHRATGKPLSETCPDCAPCHVDPLGEIANAPEAA